MLNFGADPEYFSCYEKEGKQYVLSPAMMEREFKLSPIAGDVKHPVYIRQKEFSWMMDGVAWELTLLRPHEHLTDVWKNIREALDTLAGLFSELSSSDYPSISLYTKPTINIEPDKYLPLLDDEKIYQGFIFGCDPDLDAIDLKYKCGTIDVATHLFRYAGGHIHVSGSQNISENPRPMIRLLAVTAGNFVTAKSRYPDLERMRVQTYGRPGRYRYQRYGSGATGVEYRTPSTSWTTFDQGEIEELESLIYKAENYLADGRVEVLTEFLEPTCEAIINCDQELSKSILSSLP